MPMPAIRRRWTTADVRSLTVEHRPWPRYELIAGELVVTPAAGSPLVIDLPALFDRIDHRSRLIGPPLPPPASPHPSIR